MGLPDSKNSDLVRNVRSDLFSMTRMGIVVLAKVASPKGALIDSSFNYAVRECGAWRLTWEELVDAGEGDVLGRVGRRHGCGGGGNGGGTDKGTL